MLTGCIITISWLLPFLIDDTANAPSKIGLESGNKVLQYIGQDGYASQVSSAHTKMGCCCIRG
jgi:hypothetical protein